MSKSLTEKQVLKKLNISDFRHLKKDQVISMVTMLDKMDPEVAKKALEQFPEFASTMRHIFSEYKQSMDNIMKQNAEEIKIYYDACNEIIDACKKELEKEDLSFEERNSIIQQMIIVANMISDKNSENKRFAKNCIMFGCVGIGVICGSLIVVLGGNVKFNIDALKKLYK